MKMVFFSHKYFYRSKVADKIIQNLALIMIFEDQKGHRKKVFENLEFRPLD